MGMNRLMKTWARSHQHHLLVRLTQGGSEATGRRSSSSGAAPGGSGASGLEVAFQEGRTKVRSAEALESARQKLRRLHPNAASNLRATAAVTPTWE